ncbi:MAG: aldo/keto reductase [Ruminococcaceae bacterium]|nr:aldo/keto reductase [Oscillospiraceae bacterium]
MKKVKIQKTDLEVSALCMGGCPLGGYGWGDVSRQELVNAVKTAATNGINFFDTADTYGLGESERTLAEALGSDKNNVVITTKFGVRVENGKTTYDNSRDYIFSAVEGSLKRLGRDYIDLYQVHYRDGKTPLSDVAESLERLREQGKIRYYGLSNIHKEDEIELKSLSSNPFVSFQDEYSLACRKNESEMFSFRDDFQMTPFTWGSLGQGILSGKYDKNCKFEANDRRSRDIYVNFHGEKLLKNLEIVEVLKEIANETGKSVSSVAIRWILDYLKDSVVIVGAKNPKQVLQNAESLSFELNAEQIERLEKISKE